MFKIFALSTDRPVTVEIIDSAKKFQTFAEKPQEMLDHSERGGLLTIQELEVADYKPRGKYRQVK